MKHLVRCGLLLGMLMPPLARAQAPLAGDRLDTVTVRARGEVRRLHRSQRETVLGYDFMGDSLLVLTAGTGPRPGRLLLLSPVGATVSACTLPRGAEGLFPVCTGVLNVLFDTAFCTVLLSPERGLHLSAPEPRALLAPLVACERAVGNRLYLRCSDPQRFQVSYASVTPGDSAARPFYETSDGDAELGSWEDIGKAMASISKTGDFTEFGRILRQRAMLNELAFREIDTRLLLQADTPVVADVTAGQFRFFSPAGAALYTVPMRFDRGLLNGFRIILDEATGQYYLYRFSDPARQALQAIDLHTGMPFGKVVTLERTGAGHVRVHDGRIYYLWQAGQGGETRGLYVQPGFGTGGG